MSYNNPSPINRRHFLQIAAGGAAAMTLADVLRAAEAAPDAARKNVLFIAVDDLKPLLGCYGAKNVKSPHIDALAKRGMVFTRAYCQQAVCAPSRNSLLTGKRPETIGIYDLARHFRTKLPDVVTLPQYFKQNGWHTESMGKIFHTAHGNYDDARSWSVPSQEQGPVPPEQRTRPDAYTEFSEAVFRDDDDYFEAREFAAFCGLPEPQTEPQPPKPGQPRNGPKNGPPVGMPDVADNELGDGKMADLAVKRLGELKEAARPFFLAVGFKKPHLPFVAPKKYWDLYQRDQFTPDPNPNLPEGAPPFAGHGTGEANTYKGVPVQGPVSDDLARELIHGYHACVSYTDAQIGKLLDALDKQGLRDNTIIVLWGDHGWHLGDHGQWAKHTNFENAAHAPLIVAVPGMKNAGQKCDALTEFVDIYPTLADLAGLKMPDGLEGTSMTPLLADPKRPWKTAAFHVWPRRIKNEIVGLGRAIRTDRYRLCEWTVDGKPDQAVVELYDFVADPGETVNLASKPENSALVAQLTQKLHMGWKAALPPASPKG